MAGRCSAGVAFLLGWAALWNGHPSGMSIPLEWAYHQNEHPLGTVLPLAWAPHQNGNSSCRTCPKMGFSRNKHPRGVGITPERASLGRAPFWDRYPMGMGFPPRRASPCDGHPWAGHRVHTSPLHHSFTLGDNKASLSVSGGPPAWCPPVPGVPTAWAPPQSREPLGAPEALPHQRLRDDAATTRNIPRSR